MLLQGSQPRTDRSFWITCLLSFFILSYFLSVSRFFFLLPLLLIIFFFSSFLSFADHIAIIWISFCHLSGAEVHAHHALVVAKTNALVGGLLRNSLFKSPQPPAPPKGLM